MLSCFDRDTHFRADPVRDPPGFDLLVAIYKAQRCTSCFQVPLSFCRWKKRCAAFCLIRASWWIFSRSLSDASALEVERCVDGTAGMSWARAFYRCCQIIRKQLDILVLLILFLFSALVKAKKNPRRGRSGVVLPSSPVDFVEVMTPLRLMVSMLRSP